MNTEVILGVGCSAIVLSLVAIILVVPIAPGQLRVRFNRRHAENMPSTPGWRQVTANAGKSGPIPVICLWGWQLCPVQV